MHFGYGVGLLLRKCKRGLNVYIASDWIGDPVLFFFKSSDCWLTQKPKSPKDYLPFLIN